MADQYSKLQKKWYKKLKEDGFKDIEQDEYNLRRWSNEFVRPDHNLDTGKDYNVQPKKVRNKKAEFEGKQDYYYYAEHFLNSHKFKSERERIIWEYHVYGISARETARLLKKVNIRIRKSWVSYILNELKKIMKEQYFK